MVLFHVGVWEDSLERPVVTLGVLEHAQFRVHVEREVLVPTLLVQFGGLVELPLVGKTSARNRSLLVSPASSAPGKIRSTKWSPAAVVGSALRKGPPSGYFRLSPWAFPGDLTAWLLGCCVSSHLRFLVGMPDNKSRFFSFSPDEGRSKEMQTCLVETPHSGFIHILPRSDYMVRMVCCPLLGTPKLKNSQTPGLAWLGCDSHDHGGQGESILAFPPEKKSNSRGS